MPANVIAIVGGGAAGLAAAIAAAEACARAGCPARVAVYEADERVGRSILATGNGRCNFSNAHPDPALYHNGAHVAATLAAFEARAQAERAAVLGAAGDSVAIAGPTCGAEGHASLDDARVAKADGSDADDGGSAGVAAASASWPVASNGVQAFFADHGLCWREESEGRLYPLPNKATAVLDVLRAAATAAGVEERCGTAVEAVEPARRADGPLTLRLADGRLERADAVIVAAGGSVARTLMPEGVPFRDPEPTLGPLATDTRLVRQLDNIRVRGALELWRGGARAAREEGEVMFRKYGVSGIAAFNLSRLARPGDELAVDFLPAVGTRDAAAFLTARARRLAVAFGGPVTCEDALRGLVLAPVGHVLCQAARLRGEGALDEAAAEVLAPALKGLRLAVEGLGDVRQCQVRRGGVAVEAVDPRTGACRAVPGLYVAGEALDVDAPCGGYNLHWAWASGLLAGWSAAGAVLVGQEGGARGNAPRASAAGVAAAPGAERRPASPAGGGRDDERGRR